MKKILALFLALSMLFTLVACGNSNNQATTPSTEPNQPTTDKAENITDGTEGTTGVTQAPTDEPTTTPTDGTTTPSTQAPTTVPPSTKPSTTEPPTTKPPTTEPPATESPTTKPPTTEPPATEPPVTEPVDYAALTSKYSGRWYLQGYSDIYIDISRLGNDEAMRIDATGISLPGDGVTNTSYTLYPTLIDGYDGWYHGTEIPFSAWDEWLSNKHISLNGTYIMLGNRTFVREAGTKDKYTGSFCKEALGIWYLDKNPDVQIEIKVVGGNENNGDYFGVYTRSFDLITLEHTKNDYYSITAAKANDWANLGISVSNETLTISNTYGTKIFYHEPTYPAEPPTTEPPTTEPPTTEPPTTEPPTTEPPTTEPPTIEEPLSVRVSMGVGFYMSSSSSVRGVFVETIASGGSRNYVEYYMKVYHNGNLVTEGAQKDIIVTVANGTYTAEVYVKDSNGNEASTTHSINLSGY